MTESENKKVDYIDFELQELFEGICEQVLDYLGLEKGGRFLYDNFKGFKEEIDIKIKAYSQGTRITRRLDKPDPQIMKICEGWK